jgi:hypothetical protein
LPHEPTARSSVRSGHTASSTARQASFSHHCAHVLALLPSDGAAHVLTGSVRSRACCRIKPLELVHLPLRETTTARAPCHRPAVQLAHGSLVQFLAPASGLGTPTRRSVSPHSQSSTTDLQFGNCSPPAMHATVTANFGEVHHRGSDAPVSRSARRREGRRTRLGRLIAPPSQPPPKHELWDDDGS